MKQVLLLVLFAFLATVLYAQTDSSPAYLVRSIFRSSNSSDDSSGSSQQMYFYSESCQQVPPNLLTIGQDSTEENTTPGTGTTADFIARAFRKLKRGKQDDPTPVTNSCNRSPFSVFAFLKSGSANQQCSSMECTSFDPSSSSNTIGGFWMHSNGENDDNRDDDDNDSKSMVSITTYIANQTFAAASHHFLGQQSSDSDTENRDHNQTVLPIIGWNQTPGSIEYCPGTQLLTSVFAFHSGHCVVSPLFGMNSGNSSSDGSDSQESTQSGGSLPSSLGFSQESLDKSWNIFNRYQAFYASCSDGGMVIHGCTDTSCQNCWLLSDNNGCVANWMHEQENSDDMQQMEKYYINFQGCGLGRAARKNSEESMQ